MSPFLDTTLLVLLSVFELTALVYVRFWGALVTLHPVDAETCEHFVGNSSSECQEDIYERK